MNQYDIDQLFTLKLNAGLPIENGDYDDCHTIISTIRNYLDIKLSVAEAFHFWHWRSEQWDGSWLALGDINDTVEWFKKFAIESGVEL